MDAALQLTVVGCSGSVSGPDSAASSYLIQTGEADELYSFLIDCGPGALGALYRYLDPGQIDAIGLSHLHPDHCLDLTGFYVADRYGPDTARGRPVPLYGPSGTLRRIARAYDPEPERPDDRLTGDFTAVFEERVWQPAQQVGPLRIRTALMNHPVPCLATRIELGAVSLVYSGDTGPTEALVELAQGAEVLLCEAAFVEPRPGADPNPGDLHLTGADAGRIATRAGVQQLILTHIPPWHDPEVARAEAAATFDGRINVAGPGETYTLSADPGQ